MKIKGSFLLLLLLGLGSMARAQDHTDLKEKGLNGPVKKVTSFVYDSARLENNEWIPVETSFHSRITYFYNNKGNNDSTHFLVRDKEKGHDTRLRTLYNFNNNKRSGYREFENNVLKETASITWIDDRNYLTRVKYPDTDDAAELMNSLDANYRDLRGEVRIFNGEGNMVYCSSYDNKLEGNLLTGVITVDCLSNEPESMEFIYGQPDENKNPVVIIAIDPSTRQPQKIWVRKIEYY